MSKEANKAYEEFGKNLANVKKNWKKSTNFFKKKNAALEAVKKEAGGY